MEVIKPPTSFENSSRPRVFLAGSIEMGEARDWQSEVSTALQELPGTILNPRRDNWDSSWEQSIDNPQFREQVEWELSGLDNANVIAIYFQPETKAPISLLELGLHAINSKNLVVCCPQGYWRKGNVDIVCARYGIEVVEELEDLIKAIKIRFGVMTERMKLSEFKYLIESWGGVPSDEDRFSDEELSRAFDLGIIKGYGKDKEDRKELFGYTTKEREEPMTMKLKEIMKKNKKPISEMAVTSKRLYNRIAGDLRELDIDQQAKEKVSDLLANVFTQDNPRFDRERWETAVFGHVLNPQSPENDLPF